MPIEKGRDWGEPGVLPDDSPVVPGDAEAAAVAADPGRIVGLGGGDLARTLGVRVPFDRRGPKQLLPVDVVHVELDGERTHRCVAHVVVGDPLFSRESVYVMNAAFVGTRNVAPRAHPGDGRVDVVTIRLSVGDRLKARSRMVTGSHVPHPGITTRRVAADTIDLGRRRRIRIDGRDAGRAQRIRLEVDPGALTVAV